MYDKKEKLLNYYQDFFDLCHQYEIEPNERNKNKILIYGLDKMLLDSNQMS